MDAEAVLALAAEQENLKFVPPVPESVHDLGVPVSLVEQIILKLLYFRNEATGRELAIALGLNFSVIGPLLENMKRQHLVSVRASLGMGDISSNFTLSEAGRQLAIQYIEANAYCGRVPVPLDQYTVGVKMQRHKADWLTADMLRSALKHMVISEETLSQLGPAVNAGKSFLIYGQPGNGKTFLAEGLFNIESEPIYIPFAIEFQGQIIQMYDPLYHQRLDEDEPAVTAFHHEREFDGRWLRARRRTVVQLLAAMAPQPVVLRDLALQYGADLGGLEAARDGDCILCGLCVRVCREVVRACALDFQHRGERKALGGPYGEPAPSCISCGACAAVCPVNARRTLAPAIRRLHHAGAGEHLCRYTLLGIFSDGVCANGYECERCEVEHRLRDGRREHPAFLRVDGGKIHGG